MVYKCRPLKVGQIAVIQALIVQVGGLDFQFTTVKDWYKVEGP